MTDNQKRLQELSDAYQKVQSDLSALIPTRQTLSSQLSENQSVFRELTSLPTSPTSPNIYKLVGPVLLKQERGEAELAVKGRLEFIEKEVMRVEGLIKGLQEEGERKRGEVVGLQAGMGGQG